MDINLTSLAFLIVFTALILSILTEILNIKNRFGRRQIASQELMVKILDIAAQEISEKTQSKVRANIFIRKNPRKPYIEIVYNSSNMNSAPDLNIKLEKWQGCTGHAWGYRSPTLANLSIPEAKGGAPWGLSDEQVELTKHLHAILAVPVWHPEDKNKIIAMVSFDASEPKHPGIIFESFSEGDLLDKVIAYSELISGVLREYRLLMTLD